MAGDFENRSIQAFLNGTQTSARRLKSNIDAIIEKYNRPFKNDDEINLSTLSIGKNRGFLSKAKRTYTFGASQLKSTKRKDELCKNQISHLQKCIDLNVSRAITRDYVSYIKGSNEKEDEISDAETLSSDSSGDDEGVDDKEESLEESDTESEVSDRSDQEIDSESDCSDGKDKHLLPNTRTNIRETSDLCNTSIMSTSNNLSFVSIQSPKQKTTKKLEKNQMIVKSDVKRTAYSPKLQMAKSPKNTQVIKSPDTCCATTSGKELITDHHLRSRGYGRKLSDESLHRKKLGSNTSKSVQNSKSTYSDESTPFITLTSPIRGSDNKAEYHNSYRQAVHKIPCISTRSKQNSCPQESLAKPTKSSKPEVTRPRTSPRKVITSYKNLKTTVPEQTSPGEIMMFDKNLKNTAPERTSPRKIITLDKNMKNIGMFKSPQAIKFKRIVPISVTDGKNTSSLSHHLPSSDDIKNHTHSLIETTNSQKSTANTCNKPPEYNRTLNVSFSSDEEEGMQEDLLQKCSFILESSSVSDSQEQNGPCSINKPPSVSLSDGESATNLPCDTSLTSPLNKLYINACTPNTNLRCSPTPSSTSLRSVRTFQQPVDRHVKNFVKRCLDSEISAQVKKTGPQIFDNSIKINSSHSQDRQQSHGFDQKKWVSASSPLNQIMSPPYGKLKRKASGSLTSGYFTEESASPYFLQTSSNTSYDNNALTGNTTFILPTVSKAHSVKTYCRVEDNHSNKTVSQTSSKCRNLQLISQNKSENASLGNNHAVGQNSDGINSHSQNLRHTNFTPSNGKGNRQFAVAKRKLHQISNVNSTGDSRTTSPTKQSVMDSRDNWSHSHISSQDHKQLSPPQTRDQRVSAWVRSVSNSVNPGTNVQYPSCPPKIEQKYLFSFPSCCHHLCTNPYNQHLEVVHIGQPRLHVCCHHPMPNISHTAPSLQPVSFCADAHSVHYAPCHYQPVCGGTKGAQFESSVETQRAEFDGNRETQEGQFDGHGVIQRLKLDASVGNPAESGIVYGRKGHGTGSYHEDPRTHSHSFMNESQGRRVRAVWNDIQAELSGLDIDEEGEANDSIYNNNDKPVSDSLSSIIQSEYNSVVDGVADCTFNIVPRISSFLKGGLDKIISGQSAYNSFVEAHSPMPKVITFSNTKPRGESQPVMFPPSYIEQFSPHNPRRIDSDASTLTQDNSCQELRPKKHHQKHTPSRSGHISKKPSLLPENQVPYSSCEDQPPKRRNILGYSPNPVDIQTCKSNTSHRNHGQYYHSSNPNLLNTQKECRENNAIDKIMLGSSSQEIPGYRASTPIRSGLRLPECFFDDTMSTIRTSDANDAFRRLNETMCTIRKPVSNKRDLDKKAARSVVTKSYRGDTNDTQRKPNDALFINTDKNDNSRSICTISCRADTNDSHRRLYNTRTTLKSSDRNDSQRSPKGNIYSIKTPERNIANGSSSGTMAAIKTSARRNYRRLNDTLCTIRTPERNGARETLNDTMCTALDNNDTQEILSDNDSRDTIAISPDDTLTQGYDSSEEVDLL